MIILGVSREFKNSLTCQKISRFARELHDNMGIEVLFVLLQGNYTLNCEPSDRVTGWLLHMLQDTVSYPAWTSSHVTATAAAIQSVHALRRHVIVVDTTFDKWEALADNFRRALKARMAVIKRQSRAATSQSIRRNISFNGRSSSPMGSPKRSTTSTPNGSSARKILTSPDSSRGSGFGSDDDAIQLHEGFMSADDEYPASYLRTSSVDSVVLGDEDCLMWEK